MNFSFKTRFNCKFVNETIQDIFGIIAITENKATYVFSYFYFNLFLKQSYESGLSSITYSPTLMTAFWSFYLNKFSPFLETFNKYLLDAIESGLIYKIIRSFEAPPDSDPVGPQVLTMEQIGFGFIVCGFVLALGTVVFITEFITHRIKNRLKSRNRVIHAKPKVKIIQVKEYRNRNVIV